MSAATDVLKAKLDGLLAQLKRETEALQRLSASAEATRLSVEETRRGISEIEAALRLLAPIRERSRPKHIKIVSNDEPPPEAA